MKCSPRYVDVARMNELNECMRLRLMLMLMVFFMAALFFPTLVRFPQIFMLYINLENYLAHQNKKCYAWCFYIHLAYCSNNNNNNNKEERRNRHNFFSSDSIACGEKSEKTSVWVSEFVCLFKYLPDKCWLFLFCYQNNTQKNARSQSMFACECGALKYGKRIAIQT